MSFKDEIRDEKSNEELSGLPLVAESVKLDDHIPSNSKNLFLSLTLRFSIIRPVNELWDSKILTIFLEDNNLFNLETRFSGKEANSEILFLILNEEIFFVYFGSINFPDHFFNVLITLALVFFLLSYFQSSPCTKKFG